MAEGGPDAVPAIQTEMILAGGLKFETDICGTGERLALLLHGFPESKFSWRYQMPLLARLGYTAWAPNLRGYGASSRPVGRRNYRLDLLVQDIAALIDEATSHGLGPVTLISHDWGGIIGWMFALQRVRPLERFVVMNLPHPKRFSEGLRTWAQLKRSWYILFFQMPWLPEKLLLARDAQGIADAFRNMAVNEDMFPTEVTNEYRRNAQLPGAMTAMINYYRASFGRRETRRSMADTPHLDTPTLLIWGEADTALGKELTFCTDELVSDFTVRYLPNVSHWVQQEAPETVNAMLEAWLTDKPVPMAGPDGDQTPLQCPPGVSTSPAAK